MWKAVVGGLMGCLLANPVLGFDVNGMRSGMSFAEAKEVLNTYGLGAIHIYDGKTPDASQFTLTGTPPNDPTSHRMQVLSFCKYQLISLSVNYQPDYRRFVRLLEDQIQDYGQPMSFMPSVDIFSTGEAYNLSVSWFVAGETWSINYNQYPGNFQLYRSYDAANKATLCSKSE